MGEFLSQPNKEKHSEDGENSFVKYIKKYNIKSLYKKHSYVMEYVECKDGESEWKIHT